MMEMEEEEDLPQKEENGGGASPMQGAVDPEGPEDSAFSGSDDDSWESESEPEVPNIQCKASGSLTRSGERCGLRTTFSSYGATIWPLFSTGYCAYHLRHHPGLYKKFVKSLRSEDRKVYLGNKKFVRHNLNRFFCSKAN